MYIGGKVEENEVVNLNFHFELYKHICIWLLSCLLDAFKILTHLNNFLSFLSVLLRVQNLYWNAKITNL